MTTAIYPCSSRGRPPPVTLNLKKLKGEKKLSTFIEHHSCVEGRRRTLKRKGKLKAEALLAEKTTNTTN